MSLEIVLINFSANKMLTYISGLFRLFQDLAEESPKGTTLIILVHDGYLFK